MNKQEMIDKIYLEIIGSEHKETGKYDLCMIGDIIDWIQKKADITVSRMIELVWFDTWLNDIRLYFFYKLIHIRTDARQSVQNQRIECIKYVYDLITKQ